jgi:hypothetical protein
MNGSTMHGELHRLLSDPETGLPTVHYFRLIREWEERQAKRRGTHVRVLRLQVTGGSERLRRFLGWRLGREFQTSALIASAGAGHYRLLFTGADAERADFLYVRARIQELAGAINSLVRDVAPLTFAIYLEEERVSEERRPCEPADLKRLDTPPAHPRYDEAGGEELGSRSAEC